MSYAKISVLFLYCLISTEGFRKFLLHKRSKVNYADQSDVLEYLTQYGYFDDLDVDASLLSIRDISDSIKDIQEMMGLNETGVLDRETLRIMNRPRCSNKDIVHKHHHSPEFQKLHLRSEVDPDPDKVKGHSTFFEKYTLYGTKWDKEVITYQITRYSYQPLSHDFIDSQIQAAFSAWERHIPLRFVPAGRDEQEPDIEIQFTHGEHGDNFPFPPGTSQLAHAFYPPGSGLSGDIHFNEQVNWKEENMLFYTALHEIGHTLGLRHSSNPKSIMYSHLIQDVKHGIALYEDDIAGAQHIYGKNSRDPEVTVRTTTVAPRTTSVRSSPTHVTNILRGHPICADGQFDAITSISQRRILVFRGEELVVLNENEGFLEVLEIQRIRNVYNGRIPAPIDAAFTLNHKTYLFKGTLYWRTSGFVVDEGYPKIISRNFHGIPENVDAAFLGDESKRIYFVKGAEYWEYELSKKIATRHEIRTHWRGIPYDRIDASYSLTNGTTFLFRGGRYWKLNLSSQTFASSPDLNYPRDNRLWWFSCTNFKPSFATL